MNAYLHIQPEEGDGFLMVREGGITEPRLLVMTGGDGVRLNLKEVLSLERSICRWVESTFGVEVATVADPAVPG